MTPVINKNISSHLESTRAHERVMASYAFRGGGVLVCLRRCGLMLLGLWEGCCRVPSRCKVWRLRAPEPQVLLLMIFILHYLEDPGLWELWHSPFYG